MDNKKQISELDTAKANEIKSNTQLKRYGFYQRWLIIWLTIGGFIKKDLAEEVIKWITG